MFTKLSVVLRLCNCNFVNHVFIFSDEFDDYLLYNRFFTGLQKVSGAHGEITILSTTHSFKFSEIMAICFMCDILSFSSVQYIYMSPNVM